jgi:glycosyltransferase involved in cell wall biosynthesis
MKNDELISIILPVYNGEKYLGEAIESCLNQSYKNIEVIIVNDCSTDASLSIIEKYLAIDNRIKVIFNNENKKLPASLNVGHHLAKGNFVTWTSDDNLYKENAIETLVNTLLQKKADVVYSDFIVIDEKGLEIRNVEYPGFENIIFGNFVGASFLYKKEVFERNKQYNENLFLVEDYDFWLRALVHSQFYHLEEKLYFYRKHGNSLTSEINTSEDKKELWKANLKLMYANFCLLLGQKQNEEIATYLARRLSYQQIPFEWFVVNNEIITDFKYKLKQNINFTHNSFLIEKAFLEKTLEALRLDLSGQSKLINVFFVLKNYGRVLRKNDLKQLVVFFFFK